MPHIAFLLGENYDRLTDEYAAIAAVLEARDVECTLTPWSGNIQDYQGYDAIILQSYAGYHEDLPAYMALLDSLDSLDIPIWNPTDVIRWNSDKRYLRELETKGHSMLPTVWTDKVTSTPHPGNPQDYPGSPANPIAGEPASSAGCASLQEIMQQQSWPEIVVKPAVSAGAYNTRRLNEGTVSASESWFQQLKQQQTLMIQPYAPEIHQEGEWTCMFFNGQFSHALLKTPKKGDYRVQHVHGGGYAHLAPPPALLTDAEAVIKDLPGETLYARVDGIQRGSRLIIMEVELIEPFLYLLPEQENVERFADAILQRINRDQALQIAS